MRPEREVVVDMIRYSASAHCVFGLAADPRVSATRRVDDLDKSSSALEDLLGIRVDLLTPGDLPRRSREKVLLEARPV